MSYLLLVAFITMLSCGGGGDGSDILDQNLNASGAYLCDSDCSGTCDYSSSITITQNANEFIVDDSGTILRGTIEGEDFSIEGTDKVCTGTVGGNTATATCTILATANEAAVTCQAATYTRTQ